MGNVARKLSWCSSALPLQRAETWKVLRSKRKKDQALSKNERETETSIRIMEETFQEDMVIEILSWLPVKDLLRFKCACKKWLALIEDRHFIEKHMNRAAFFMTFNKRRVITAGHKTSELICGCDGLTLHRINYTRDAVRYIYSITKYCIRNRSTRQKLDLPDPHETSIGMAFSFIPSAGEYKLVSLFEEGYRSGDVRWEVLTVGKDNSWRPLVGNLQDCNKKSEKTMLVSAGCVVHCIRIIEVCSKFTAEVVSFDMVSETFASIVLPHEMFSDWKKVWALDWNGFLSFADRMQENLNVMVLEDYKNLKWGKGRIVVPLTSMMKSKDLVEDLVPVVAKSGDLWFWLKYKGLIGFNLETMKIRHQHAFKKRKTAAAFYLARRSLVSLKGMRPDH